MELQHPADSMISELSPVSNNIFPDLTQNKIMSFGMNPNPNISVSDRGFSLVHQAVY